MKKIPNDEYKKILENMPICCVDILVHQNGKVLLVHRTEEPCKGQWWIPGGRLFKNEKLTECAKRKAKEELGIEVDVEKQTGIYETFFGGTHAISICFLVKPKDNSKIKMDDTGSDYKWVSKIEENLDPYIKDVLRDSKVF